jgi:hypothetical protein
VFVESFWANDIIEDSIELIKSTVVVIFILIAAKSRICTVTVQ